TTFRVFLPVSKGSGKAAGESALVEKPPRGTETILVVEDEAPVRELVCSVLKTLGYQVLEASSGAKAWDVWQKHKDQIKLVLTDIIMPGGMTGRDLVEQIHGERPDLKAIYTSGYSSDIVGKDFVLHEGVNYLQKPFLPQVVARAIRKCLDEK
ncbi:MAG TPA: response regulator, partial [Candidatus Angelobacter sp.]|nr:response regulator [Candidatus Angelobacter sp.]